MSWEDRLQEAAYTPEGGERLTFRYLDVSENFTKRGTAYDFANFDGSLVIPTGRSSKRFPLQIKVMGDDYDLEATALIIALGLPGVGKLEHPFYGTVNVVPLGDISRSDNPHKNGDMANIDAVFFETILDTYPDSADDLANLTALSVEEFVTSAAENFSDVTDSKASGFRAGFESTLNVVSSITKPLADANNFTARLFNDIEKDINKTLKTFIDDPLNLGYQTLRLIQTPGQLFDNLQARLKAAGNLLNGLIGGTYNSTNDLMATGALSLSVLSSINSDFVVKSDALITADLLLTQFEALNTWREENLEADTSGVYETLQKSIALAAGYLVQISFTLKQQRVFYTQGERSIIDLCVELYGNLDQLDFFITSNDFSGSEILEIPRNTAVLYYV